MYINGRQRSWLEEKEKIKGREREDIKEKEEMKKEEVNEYERVSTWGCHGDFKSTISGLCLNFTLPERD